MAGMPIRRARRNPDASEPIPRLVRVTGWKLRWGKPHGNRGVPRQLKSKYTDWVIYVGDRWHGKYSSMGAGKRELARMTPETIERVLRKHPIEPADTHPWERYDLGSASGKVVAWWGGAQPRENPMPRRNPDPETAESIRRAIKLVGMTHVKSELMWAHNSCVEELESAKAAESTGDVAFHLTEAERMADRMEEAHLATYIQRIRESISPKKSAAASKAQGNTTPKRDQIRRVVMGYLRDPRNGRGETQQLYEVVKRSGVDASYATVLATLRDLEADGELVSAKRKRYDGQRSAYSSQFFGGGGAMIRRYIDWKLP